MKKIFILLAIIFLPACTKLEHLDQLLTLKDYSQEQDNLEKYVKEQNRKFDLLVKAVKGNTLAKYKTKRSILKNFGEPILVEEIQKDNAVLSQWLYRYAKEYFNNEKVYLFFDARGKLVDWQYINPKDPQADAS